MAFGKYSVGWWSFSGMDIDMGRLALNLVGESRFSLFLFLNTILLF